jgi:hypothetical protein
MVVRQWNLLKLVKNLLIKIFRDNWLLVAGIKMCKMCRAQFIKITGGIDND